MYPPPSPQTTRQLWDPDGALESQSLRTVLRRPWGPPWSPHQSPPDVSKTNAPGNPDPPPRERPWGPRWVPIALGTPSGRVKYRCRGQSGPTAGGAIRTHRGPMGARAEPPMGSTAEPLPGPPGLPATPVSVPHPSHFAPGRPSFSTCSSTLPFLPFRPTCRNLAWR